MVSVIIMLAVFTIELVVNNLILADRCYRLEMKLRHESYKEDR